MDKNAPEKNLTGEDVGQKHMRVEAALAKLIQDYPNSGGKALIDAQKGVAQPIQIDMLSHPDRGMATPDGRLTELGEDALKTFQNKINEILHHEHRKDSSPSIAQDQISTPSPTRNPAQAIAPAPLSREAWDPSRKLSKQKAKPGPEIG